MNGFPFKNDRGMSVIGTNPQNLSSITWSTGPGGTTNVDPASPDQPPTTTEPAAVKASAGIGVAEDVIAVSTGPGSESSRVQDNTDIFKTVADQL